ncbi:MAG: hypothetical protein Q4D02_00835 [Clostridia bacterium]|nr:hypothetical protein [Clostridia bacterium]
MKVKEKFSSFNKNSVLSQKINEQIRKLPINEEVTHEILEKLDNHKTKIVLDSDIKNSYYVYLNDTIYLSNREKVIKDSSRIVLIAHEARHSVQSKILQKLNFILSNIELIIFCINIILWLLKKVSYINIYLYILVVIISAILRMILEFDAVIGSIKIAKEYLQDKVDNKNMEFIMSIYQFKIKCLMPLFVINLLWSKVIRLIVLVILKTI